MPDAARSKRSKSSKSSSPEDVSQARHACVLVDQSPRRVELKKKENLLMESLDGIS